jgi:hypothetical protein
MSNLQSASAVVNTEQILIRAKGKCSCTFVPSVIKEKIDFALALPLYCTGIGRFDRPEEGRLQQYRS